MRYIFIVTLFCICTSTLNAQGHFPLTKSDSIQLQHFKTFSNKFFIAVKKNDTAFLKQHILFPITHHTFFYLDPSLGSKPISSKIFFKKLSKLFDEEYINNILKGQAEFSIYDVNKEARFMISIYHETDGIDSNVNWHFKQQQGEFYFYTYTAEAG
ncbi:MAG TPA: hypothetical protein VNS32_20570 [Flavisolibacter sp.]|nr:hypothetical protein [Flavisolibacter sp.]